MPDRSYRWLIAVLAVLGLAADQASKYGVFDWLSRVDSRTYAVFQTEPEQRTFAVVPFTADPVARAAQRGFFLEVAFEPDRDAAGNLVPHVNHGALFGFLREHRSLANGLFAVVSLIAAAAIVLWGSHRTTAADRWLCAALGLILAGTLGNFFDRVMFNGVRDFLHWHYGFDWPVFNVADCCLVVGAGLLLLQAFLAPHPTGSVGSQNAESLKQMQNAECRMQNAE
ncbi:MAG: signal peptidase II [Gemmataceae bacterium]